VVAQRSRTRNRPRGVIKIGIEGCSPLAEGCSLAGSIEFIDRRDSTDSTRRRLSETCRFALSDGIPSSLSSLNVRRHDAHAAAGNRGNDEPCLARLRHPEYSGMHLKTAFLRGKSRLIFPRGLSSPVKSYRNDYFYTPFIVGDHRYISGCT